jgi:hypothetical protein
MVLWRWWEIRHSVRVYGREDEGVVDRETAWELSFYIVLHLAFISITLAGKNAENRLSIFRLMTCLSASLTSKSLPLSP